MHFSSKALLLSLFPFALAQYGGGGGAGSSSTTTSAASTATSSAPGLQIVTVGDNNAIAFSPDTITAAVGSSIEFVFFPPIHSVTQSTFESPCAPLANGTGFWSGAFTTASGKNANVFTLIVNDTNPIWFFCATPSHCEAGMAGVINPSSNGSESLDQYKASAAKVSNPPTPSVVQGGSIGPPKAASSSSSTSSGPPKAASSSSSTSSAATTTPTKSAGVNGYESRSSAQWVLMALAGLLAVGIGGLIN
ncbi:hypothetical protein GMDG_01900 [Pseudogymnoascus destructans 20631-21]|uniref:Phytocyanin domain-containing protein n=1 Tax=Pseudogymnoascus destructans (strain ATCC MYA-4855 / 20631-21) TaxID=658429 RepID=L8FZB6_PSED2|nr:hypothetical protein GMDG_01900 [Pseudogymnoascus destructans 20631-21]